MTKKQNNHLNKRPASEKTADSGLTPEKLTEKKAAVLGTDNKSRISRFAGLFFVALLGIGAFFYLFYVSANTGNTGKSSATTSPIETSADGSRIFYAASLFDDGKARHFEYKNKNITIKYFVLKSSDGLIRAAFDACDVCWPSGKGYFQEGDHMVCRNCGRRFASVLINEVKGGCNPAPLARRIEGDRLIFEVKDILEGTQYFNFSGKV